MRPGTSNHMLCTGARRRAALTTVAALLGLARASAAAEPLTFTKDIAPIVFEHCAVCHRAGEVGPFPLVTYADVRQHLTQIVDVTGRRVMPPWKPERGKGEFLGDRSLPDEQIARIRQWAADGAAEGRPEDLPTLPQFPGGWRLGRPDIVVTMAQPFSLRPDGNDGGDVFRTFVLPVPTDTPKYVRAMEFRPGTARAVHHVNIGVDRTSSSRRLDAADPEPGYVGGMVPDADYPPGYMLGWTPGQQPRPSPDGMPWRLEPHSDIVIQLHMQPTGKPELVQASVGLYFTDEKPTRTPVGLRLGSETIDIPAGDAAYEIRDQYLLPVDVELLAVQPHAHNLARQMTAEAALPDGTVRPLISIRDWDFRWQDVYRYAQPVVLPRGTTIAMRYTYDNSAANPRNPFSPPRRIVWGQNTSDEMGDLWLQLVPREARDLPALVGDVSRKTRTEDLAAYTKVMKSDPSNPLRHDAVAMLYLQNGQPAEAEAEFRESLRLNPDSAPSHYNRGLALSMLRRYQEAAAEFQQAVRIDPEHAEAHNNLGAMLYLSGRFAEAELHYRRATEIRPDNAEAHSNLARLLVAEGKYRAAIDHFAASLAQQPDAPAALSGLALVLAASPDAGALDPPRAVELGERAVQVTGRSDLLALDALAAAYASAGRFTDAIRTAREAVQLADASGNQAMLGEIRDRLRRYEQSLPYRLK